MAILARDGSTRAVIPLQELVPTHQIDVLERSSGRLVLDAPRGSNDPILHYTPSSPITLRPSGRMMMGLLARIGIWWIGGIFLVWAGQRSLQPAVPALRRLVKVSTIFADANPCLAIIATALIATVLATYPVLLFGRSFGAPNNGGTFMLYDQPPFVPGSTDLAIEDTRGSDVGAMMWQSVPHSHVQREALAMGEVPLWNRYNAAGRPLWGQGLSYILDPLHWLTLVTRDPGSGWDIKFVAHRFVFAAGIGLAALAATGVWLPSALAAAAAPFAGVFAYRLNHPAIFSLTYAPWVLLGWFLLARASARIQHLRALALIAVASSLVLVASPPKEAIVTLLGMETTGAAIVLWSAESWRQGGQRFAAGCIAGVIVVLLTMPHWLVFLDTLLLSFTAYENPQVIRAGLPHAIALFLSPLVPGVPFPGLHPLALVMAIAALTAPRRLLEHHVLSCAIGAAGLITVAFGVMPEAWLLRVPLIAQIGHIHDALPTAALTLLLVVCAVGADVLLRSGLLRALIISVIAGIASWWLLARVSETTVLNSFELWALFLLLPIAVALPGCWLAARRESPGLLPLIAAGVAPCVLLLPGGLHVNSHVPGLDKLLIQPRERATLDENSPAVDAMHHASTEPVRTTGLDSTLFPGTQALYELEGIGGADPLEVPAYRELVDAAGITRAGVWLTLISGPDLLRLAPLLDMLNVRFLLARSGSESQGFVDVPVPRGDRLRVGRRATAWPRAFFVDEVSTYVDAPDLLRKVAAVGRPFAAVQAGDQRAADFAGPMGTGSGTVVAASGYKLTPNTTSFAIRAPGPGVAVLTETFLPEDFRATLNGNPVPYFRVNHAFKAVRIPSGGVWIVKFEYRPARWEFSLTMASLGIALLVGLGIWAKASR
jgi:hypothetical protein